MDLLAKLGLNCRSDNSAVKGRGLRRIVGRLKSSNTYDYQYTPLQDGNRDIRLIELLPGRYKDTIRVKIHHVPLVEPDEKPRRDSIMTVDQLQATLPPEVIGSTPNPSIEKTLYEPILEESFEPKYEAISYAWGINQELHIIEILSSEIYSDDATQNNSSGSAKLGEIPIGLAITDSLWNVLRHLRSAEKSRMLWADAICINQNDDAEKSPQVRRMGEIYRLAYRVIVWLGLEADNSKLALSTFEHVAAQIEFGEQIWFRSPNAGGTDWLDKDFQLSFSDETIVAITDLLDRARSKRSWVAQEIHLANKYPGALVQCGLDTTSFCSIQKAIILLRLRSLMSNQTLRNRLTVGYNLFHPKSDITLQRLLGQSSVGRLCQDPRDKIYGILGLAPRRFASMIQPDYREACPTNEVYKTAFVTHVQVSQRLEFFDYCFKANKKSLDFNSWIPDWSAEVPIIALLEAQFATTTSRVAFIYEKKRPNILQVLGKRCAVINFVTTPLSKNLDHVAAIQQVRQCQPLELDTAIYRPTGESLRHAYAFTLINGDVRERHVDYGEEGSLTFFIQQALVSGIFGGSDASIGKSGISSSSEIHSLVVELLSYCTGRVFFQTREGYIGLAPGDIISILLGCSNPVVLRPTKDGSYQFIGECFVHGLNDAIGLLGPLPIPWKVMVRRGRGSRGICHFFNTETGEETVEDPRLEPLTEWERIEREVDADDPQHYDFVNTEKLGRSSVTILGWILSR